MRRTITLLGLAALCALGLVTVVVIDSASVQPVSADGVGGTISLGTPAGNKVPVNTTAATDGWVGFNLHVGTAVSTGVTLTSISGANGTALTGTSFCAAATPVAGERVLGCTGLENQFITAAGLLATFTFNATGNGCIQAHLITAPGSAGYDTYTADASTVTAQAVTVDTTAVSVLVGAGTVNDCPGVLTPTDADHDGVPDVSDNCPFVSNPDQKNTDAGNTALNLPGADTLGDACDPDVSGDGYGNAAKQALGKDLLVYCPIMRADVDGDGVVTVVDVSRLALRFGQPIPPAPERLGQDADHVISMSDLSRQASAFGKPVTLCPDPTPADTPTPVPTSTGGLPEATATLSPTATLTPKGGTGIRPFFLP